MRIDTIQFYKKNSKEFISKAEKLILASEEDRLIGQWNDNGRLSDDEELK